MNDDRAAFGCIQDILPVQGVAAHPRHALLVFDGCLRSPLQRAHLPAGVAQLPRYFAADWAAIYAKHCERSWTVRMLGWTPPYYGCDADEWPVPGKTPVPRRPRLSLVPESGAAS